MQYFAAWVALVLYVYVSYSNMLMFSSTLCDYKSGITVNDMNEAEENDDLPKGWGFGN